MSEIHGIACFASVFRKDIAMLAPLIALVSYMPLKRKVFFHMFLYIYPFYINPVEPDVINRNSRQLTAGNRQPFDYFLSDAPHAAGFSDAPQAAGLSDAPQAAGFSDAPQATGFSDAPQAAGFSDAPQAAGFSDAPQEAPVSFFFQVNRFFSAIIRTSKYILQAGQSTCLVIILKPLNNYK
jgi:hypothetical protein